MKIKRSERCTNLFTNYGKTVKEPDSMHDKLIEISNDSSLLNSRDLMRHTCKDIL